MIVLLLGYVSTCVPTTEGVVVPFFSIERERERERKGQREGVRHWPSSQTDRWERREEKRVIRSRRSLIRINGGFFFCLYGPLHFIDPILYSSRYGSLLQFYSPKNKTSVEKLNPCLYFPSSPLTSPVWFYFQVTCYVLYEQFLCPLFLNPGRRDENRRLFSLFVIDTGVISAE